MQFTETLQIETGFAPIYGDRIVPELERLERERQVTATRATKLAAIPLGAAVLLGLLFALSADTAVELLFAFGLPVVFGALGAFLVWKWQERGWAGSVAQSVMPAVCDFVGDLDYDRDATMRFPVDHARALGVVGGFDRSELSDRMEGTYRGASFELVEARLSRRTTDSDGDSKKRTVFRGLLFRIGVPAPAPGRILIARDFSPIGNRLAGLFSGKAGRGMPQVTMDHARFEEAFEVHADDPEAARAYLPPAFLDNLLAIGEKEGGRTGVKGMTAAFQDRSFYLALARDDDFMAMGRLHRPVGGLEEDLHKVFGDIALVRRIIDRLHGDHPEDDPGPRQPRGERAPA